MQIEGLIDNNNMGKAKNGLNHSVKFNAIMNMILMSTNSLVTLITLPYVTRVLSVEGYGAVGFAQSTAAWFSVLCLLGIPIYGIRECAKVRDNTALLAQTVKELLTLTTISTFVVLSVFAACIIVIPQFKEDSPLMWIFFLNTLITSYGVEWFYQALEQYSYITIRSIIFKIISLFLTFSLVKNPNDYIIYGAILAIATCGNNILNIIHLHKYITFNETHKLDLRQHIKPVISFGIGNISSSVYLWLDSVILGFLTSGHYQVGLYQLAVKAKSVLSAIINAATSAAIPRLSYYVKNGMQTKYEKLLGQCILIVCNLGLFIVGYLLVFAKDVIFVVSSAKYFEATKPLQIISIAMLFSALNTVIGYQILTPLNMENKLALANSIGVVFCLFFNFTLDSHFGAVGAAAAAAITEIIVFVVQLKYSFFIISHVFDKMAFCKILVAIILAMTISYTVKISFPFMRSILILSISFISFLGVWLLTLILLHEKSITTIFRRSNT